MLWNAIKYVAVVFVLLVVIGLFVDDPAERAEVAERAAAETPEERAARQAQEARDALAARNCKRGNLMPGVMSRRFVERELRAPSTASFPRDPEIRYLGECSFQVISYVDAQNGFGGTVRTHYMVTLTFNPDSDTWSARDLSFLN